MCIRMSVIVEGDAVDIARLCFYTREREFGASNAGIVYARTSILLSVPSLSVIGSKPIPLYICNLNLQDHDDSTSPILSW